MQIFILYVYNKFYKNETDIFWDIQHKSFLYINDFSGDKVKVNWLI